ncbi:MAG TPA: acyltransferase, partial [Bryobacteraceae bacterium]|nr:acyltransferase [Bryobacteraceae bacterium]
LLQRGDDLLLGVSLLRHVEPPRSPLRGPQLPTISPISIGTTSGFWINWALKVVSESGAFGVCLFFVLSSYLITELLLRENEATGAIHLKEFYVRRVLRIWPLYFGFIALCILLGWFYPPWRLDWMRVAGFVFLAGNWYTGAFGYTSNPISPLWSVSLEEQFYLLWPWLARCGRRVTIALAAATLPFSMAMLVWLASQGADSDAAVWTNSFVQFLFFGCGALLCFALRRSSLSRSPWRAGVLVTGGALCWFIAEAVTQIKAKGGQPGAMQLCEGYVLVAAGSCLLLLGFLSLPASAVPKPLAYLGKISYGLYVYHELCIYLSRRLFATVDHGFTLAAIVSLAATIGMAILSYELYERRFLKLKERFTFVPSRAA